MSRRVVMVLNKPKTVATMARTSEGSGDGAAVAVSWEDGVLTVRDYLSDGWVEVRAPCVRASPLKLLPGRCYPVDLSEAARLA